MNALCRSMELFFFFFVFQRSSNNLRYAFLALKVAIQAFTERCRSARQKAITFFAARFAESSLWGELGVWLADGGAASQLQQS